LVLPFDNGWFEKQIPKRIECASPRVGTMGYYLMLDGAFVRYHAGRDADTAAVDAGIMVFAAIAGHRDFARPAD